MTRQTPDIAEHLASVHPFDRLTGDERGALVRNVRQVDARRDTIIYRAGEPLEGLYVVADGQVEIRAPEGEVLSILGSGESFGERGLMRDGLAATEARALADSRLLLVPADAIRQLAHSNPSFARLVDRRRLALSERETPSLAAIRVSELMTRNPITCAPDETIRGVATIMRDQHVSSVLVVEDERLAGIVTTRDLTKRALAAGLPIETPVRDVMTPDPVTLDHDAIGADVLHELLERRIGHLPVVDRGRLVGMLTQTDLTRYQALLSADLIDAIVGSPDVDGIATVVGRIPELLAQLVGIGHRHDIVTRLITDVADAATRRLLRLAEATLGPAPVPYLWLACGSQGRQEQTGVSDQDNCLFLDDAAGPEHEGYFGELARIVSDGLAACGYYYCPGDMMATNPRWRQPIRVWREYFAGWIRTPDPMAQMLASVMFDLRPIGGEASLFRALQVETLRMASENSIFVAHMVANSLKHTPPLGLLRGVSTIRSGEHKDRVDLKLNGVVPVVDLGRIYMLKGRLGPANTRARLQAAVDAGVVSASGGRELIDAYDLIAETRLRHQAAQVRAGDKPDNFMAPASLSDLERSHLRDAFVVVRTMQSALGHGRPMG